MAWRNFDDRRAYVARPPSGRDGCGPHINGDLQIAEDGWWLGRYDQDEMPFETSQIAVA